MKALRVIVMSALPVILMIGLIPLVPDDRILAAIYAVIIVGAFAVRRERHDFLIFAFGVVALTISEYFFVSTGVETFTRQSLLGVMPLWLPLLWGYAFIAIKRSVIALDRGA